MDPSCEFLREYVPAEAAVDRPLAIHLDHCRDCRREVVLVGSDTAWTTFA